MVDPRSDTQYTCESLDGGQEPIVSFLFMFIFFLPMKEVTRCESPDLLVHTHT